MGKNIFSVPGGFVILCIAVMVVLLVRGHTRFKEPTKENTSYTPFDDTRKSAWGKEFEVVKIKSKSGDHIQKAYFYHAKAEKSRPLVVSLHTWSGTYTQQDEISGLSRSKDLNYIHPDFRGANTTGDACCSEPALNDIDEAIAYAITHSKVDTSRIYIIGVSGGGYATLAAFMRLKHPVKRFSAWASISDLVAWFHESEIRKNKYAADILKCTLSDDGDLNILNAKGRSPLYWKTPLGKVSTASLFIHAGIHDGVTGSVPFTHSINFYNKILADYGVSDSSKYISASEKEKLLEDSEPVGIFDNIGDRKVYAEKQYKNVRLVIFEGGHEMLTEFAFNELLEE